MIDIENQVIDLVTRKVRETYPNIFITGEYVRAPSSFPAIAIEEKDNQVWRNGRDSVEIENFAEVMYEVNVWSNKTFGNKAEAKEIAKVVDDAMKGLGFTRRMLNPIPNLEDATIYRLVARYRAVVGYDEEHPENYVIYKR